MHGARPRILRSVMVDLLLTAVVIYLFTQLIVPEITDLLAEMTAGIQMGLR